MHIGEMKNLYTIIIVCSYMHLLKLYIVISILAELTLIRSIPGWSRAFKNWIHWTGRSLAFVKETRGSFTMDCLNQVSTGSFPSNFNMSEAFEVLNLVTDIYPADSSNYSTNYMKPLQGNNKICIGNVVGEWQATIKGQCICSEALATTYVSE